MADSIALAQAMWLGGKLVTADHHEFDPLVGVDERLKIHWFR